MSLLSGTLSHQPAMRPAVAIAAAFLFGLTAGLWLHNAFGDAAPAVAAPAPGTAIRAVADASAVTVLRVGDGDTFDARVQVWPGIEIATKVRLRGIDTPEMKAQCNAERVKAEAARAALVRMLDDGAITLSRVGVDKYGGRVLADVATRAHADVGAMLVRDGHARPYDGGKRAGWC